MKSLFMSIKRFLRSNNKSLYFRRKSRIIVGRAFQRLDKTEFLGENVPYAVLEYFSENGV